MEMGPAPHATGWFGRGSAGSNASVQYEGKNKEYLERPARKQADAFVGKNTVLEGAYEYNIWYNKYIGEHWDDRKGKDPADTRCLVEKDAGFTRGDNKVSASSSPHAAAAADTVRRRRGQESTFVCSSPAEAVPTGTSANSSTAFRCARTYGAC
jgi:hypothetical protein